jgi:hypothetical protein
MQHTIQILLASLPSALGDLVFTLARALGRFRRSESCHLHHPLSDMKDGGAALDRPNTICAGGLLGLVLKVELLLEVAASSQAAQSDDLVVLGVREINCAHVLACRTLHVEALLVAMGSESVSSEVVLPVPTIPHEQD